MARKANSQEKAELCVGESPDNSLLRRLGQPALAHGKLHHLGAAAQSKFFADADFVGFDGLDAQVEFLSDAARADALADELQGKK